MPAFEFDPKIRYGDIISWAVIIVTVIGSLMAFQRKWDVQQHQVEGNSMNIQNTAELLKETRLDVKENREARLRREAIEEAGHR